MRKHLWQNLNRTKHSIINPFLFWLWNWYRPKFTDTISWFLPKRCENPWKKTNGRPEEARSYRLRALRSQKYSTLRMSDSAFISNNQICFSSDSALYITSKTLNSTENTNFQSRRSTLNGAAHHFFSWIQNVIFCYYFSFPNYFEITLTRGKE